MKRWLLASISGLAFAVASAGPAAADPATAIITAAGVSSTGIAASLIRLGVGLALSYVAQRIAGQQQRPQNPGIRTETTTEGGTVPQTRILGRYATSGNVVAPFYSQGSTDVAENAYRWSVYDLADHPITAMRRLWIDGKRWDPLVDGMGGSWTGSDGVYPTDPPAENDDWVASYDTPIPMFRAYFRDGTQTTALAELTSRFGSHDERPWTSDMIGRGVPYMVMRYRFISNLFRGEPSVLFEVDGEKLYDRRADTTDGGSGAQRANDSATWAFSQNPIVQIENILRGLPLWEGGTWGLGVETAELPRGPWVDAAQYCDGSAPYGVRYQTGFEIRMATADAGGDTALDVIDELLAGCNGALADIGGVWVPRVGAPGASVATLTDDDLIADEPQTFTVHEGATDIFNAARVSHPRPNAQWKASEAPLWKDDTWIARDGQMLVADLTLPAVSSRPQAKALARAYVRDSRRVRRHAITLPPRYQNILPLDAITWTSARNGYEAKKFEVFEVAHDPRSLCVTLAIRERDPADYDWTEADLTDDPEPSGGVNRPQYLAFTGFDAQAWSVKDNDGVGRDPAVRILWPRNTASRRIQIQGRRVGSTEIHIDRLTADVDEGVKVISSGIREGVDYEFRVRGLKPRTGWSAWDQVTKLDLEAAQGEVLTPRVYDRSFARFRRGPHSQNQQTAGWRSASGTFVRVGAFQLRKTAGAVSRFTVSFRVGSWGDYGAAQLRILRKKPDGTNKILGSVYGRAGRRGAWTDATRIIVDEDKSGADKHARMGTQTTFFVEIRRNPNGGDLSAVRVNDIQIEAVNVRNRKK